MTTMARTMRSALACCRAPCCGVGVTMMTTTTRPTTTLASHCATHASRTMRRTARGPRPAALGLARALDLGHVLDHVRGPDAVSARAWGHPKAQESLLRFDAFRLLGVVLLTRCRVDGH